MHNYDWPIRFREIHERAVTSYRSGKQKAGTLFTPDEKEFLAAIGCTPQELFDFVEDFARGGEPVFETVLLITAARRDYFLVMQKGKPTGRVIDMDQLPPKDAQLAGLKWLPRIIEKARVKLRGEMPEELMYGCGGDRPFLKSVNVEPGDFLRVVWAAGEDNQRVIDYVLACKKALPR
jgi:hypothetical protein